MIDFLFAADVSSFPKKSTSIVVVGWLPLQKLDLQVLLYFFLKHPVLHRSRKSMDVYVIFFCLKKSYKYIVGVQIIVFKQMLSEWCMSILPHTIGESSVWKLSLEDFQIEYHM